MQNGFLGEPAHPAGIGPEQHHVTFVVKSLFEPRPQALAHEIHFLPGMEHHGHQLQHGDGAVDLGHAHGGEHGAVELGDARIHTADDGWFAALAFRIGTEYQASSKLTVLGGLHYDESPIRDEYINPEFIDANRIGASAGFSYQFAPHLALEAAYSFDYGQLRTARTNQSQERVSNVSGTYRSVTHAASVGVAMAF